MLVNQALSTLHNQQQAQAVNTHLLVQEAEVSKRTYKEETALINQEIKVLRVDIKHPIEKITTAYDQLAEGLQRLEIHTRNTSAKIGS